MTDIEQIAKQHCIEYYTHHYSTQPPIDFDNLRAQVEAFTWQNAHYRIDLSFLHLYPHFIPFEENFWKAHRLFLTKKGKVVMHDPVYTSFAVHPEKTEKAVENILGFYPGNRYYQDKLDLVHHAITRKKILSPGTFPAEKIISLELSNGLTDLEKYQATIIEFQDRFAISFDGSNYEASSKVPIGLGHQVIQFNVYKNGEISEATSILKIEPGLC